MKLNFKSCLQTIFGALIIGFIIFGVLPNMFSTSNTEPNINFYRQLLNRFTNTLLLSEAVGLAIGGSYFLFPAVGMTVERCRF